MRKAKFSLDALRDILPVLDEVEQMGFVGGGDGTKENPFTKDQFYNWQGLFPGGVVEGIGLVQPDIVIYGYTIYNGDGTTTFTQSVYVSDNFGSYTSNYNTFCFSGFKSTDETGCLNRCIEMLSYSGCSLSGAVGSEIAMANHDANGRATTATSNYQEGLNYIDSELSNNHRVIVSVDYKSGTSMGSTRADQAGDHFVIIVGGNSSTGYYYFDPATSNVGRGTSNENIFTSNNGLLQDKNNCTLEETHNYTVTGVRKNN